MLYVISPQLIYFIPRNLYLLVLFTHLPPIRPPSLWEPPVSFLSSSGPVVHGLAFCGFSYLQSAMAWNTKWKIPEINNSWVFKSQVVLSSMMKSYTILLAHARGPHSPTLSAPNIQASSSSVVQDHPKQIVLLLTYSQKVKWSLTPSHSACHSPHSISSCRHFIISGHHKEKGGYSRIR